MGVIAILAASAISSAGGANEQTVGLFVNDAESFDGYTLFGQMQYPAVYLIDNDGRLVHSWDDVPGGSVPYLLEDGSLIRERPGGVQWQEWDGTLRWDFEMDGGHHDIEVLPNGNVLMIVSETKSSANAIAEGRDPALLPSGELVPEAIFEIQPTGLTTGEVVWEWHSWDHLIQDYDPARNNFGVVGDNPELIDINYFDPIRPADADWHHSNSVDYNEEFDQVILSVRHFSEFWVIDHSTTTEEAAGHGGGNSGKGGDLLYRWGNPQAYRAGGPSDQQLHHQHDAQWIEAGLPGEGNILVFNNGFGRPGGNYSSVEEIVPPVDGFGNYTLTSGEAYGPSAPVWTYADPCCFYSPIISGAQRLPSGTTLIDEGEPGWIFEVTPAGDTVWLYVNPVDPVIGPLVQGDRVVHYNSVFRANRYPPNYPGLQGRDLTPGDPIELPKPEPTPTPEASPAAPKNLRAFVVQNQRLIQLIWEDHAQNEVTFVVERSLLGPDGPWVVVASLPANTTTHGDGGLADGVTYWYRVAAENTFGRSNYSDVVFGTATSLTTAPVGDADCSGDVTSIDAALVLQLTAGLLTSLSCEEFADADGDGELTSIDSALILQHVAGLIDSLPP